jgi:hypothetical protein
MVVAAAALVSIGGVIGSTFVTSPAQSAADQGPPSPSVITAPVVKQVLVRTVVVRGTVVAGSSLTFTPTAAQGATTLVVTRVTKRSGDRVGMGEVLVEVSGRPVIALPGGVPAYRDLKPGDTGDDIAELQAALRRLGYPSSDRSGNFGPGTKGAVAKLYRHLRYEVPTTGGPGDEGDAEALNGANQAVTMADRAVTEAATTASKARAAWGAAQAAVPANPSAVSSAKDALDAAVQNLTYARQDLVTAQKAKAHLIATTGVEMPLNEFVFVPSFPAHLSALKGTVGTTVAAPLITLDVGALAVHSRVQETDRNAVKLGMAVHLVAEQLDATAVGKLTRIDPYSAGSQGATQGEGQGGQAGTTTAAGYPVVVTPSTALPPAWLGQDVRVTIDAASTPKPVLVVPVAAVSTGQDGTTTVTVLHKDGARVRVPVRAGLASNGLVEVTPAGSELLRPGDLVITG